MIVPLDLVADFAAAIGFVVAPGNVKDRIKDEGCNQALSGKLS